MNTVQEADPIWGQPAQVTQVGDCKHIESARTGNFQSPNGMSNYIQNWTPEEKAKLSTWILNQNLQGEIPRVDPSTLEEVKRTRPISISQKIDQFLIMLEKGGFRPGSQLPWSGLLSPTQVEIALMNKAMMWIEAVRSEELRAFREILLDAGIINGGSKHGDEKLAYAGFKRIEELRTRVNGSTKAFVAMWFDPTMLDAYEKGIKPALTKSGYNPVRIDQKEHNNKIDDEIIAEIRQSNFLVADFTCGLVEAGTNPTAIARGGVYYEAGFAQGLGLPVIWCVRSDQINHVHFDTRQFNHITWVSPDELREKLYNRIAAVIGVRPQA